MKRNMKIWGLTLVLLAVPVLCMAGEFMVELDAKRNEAEVNVTRIVTQDAKKVNVKFTCRLQVVDESTGEIVHDSTKEDILKPNTYRIFKFRYPEKTSGGRKYNVKATVTSGSGKVEQRNQILQPTKKMKKKKKKK